MKSASIGIVAALIALSPAAAQQDQSLQDQLVGDSFKLTGSATSAKINWFWRTTVTYTIVNNSGMNLYLGILTDGATLGGCSNLEYVTGGLMLVPAPDALSYSQSSAGPPRGMFVPSGGRVSGNIVFRDCAVENPGESNVPLSIALMLGKTEAWKKMSVRFPLSADVPVKEAQ